MLLHSRLQFRVLGPLSVLVLAYLLSLYLTPLAPHGQQAALREGEDTENSCPKQLAHAARA